MPNSARNVLTIRYLPTYFNNISRYMYIYYHNMSFKPSYFIINIYISHQVSEQFPTQNVITEPGAPRKIPMGDQTRNLSSCIFFVHALLYFTYNTINSVHSKKPRMSINHTSFNGGCLRILRSNMRSDRGGNRWTCPSPGALSRTQAPASSRCAGSSRIS